MDKTLSVTLAGGATTDVFFTSDVKDLSLHLSSYGRNVLWVFDVNSAGLFSELPQNRIVLDSGESTKLWPTIERILSAAVDFSLARDSRFIGFGGGVVCDMTALASALYMRGAELTLVPTTLLCMVDASVGGKAAVDFKGAKNLIGTFYPASEVLISPDTLRTLSDREYLCGLGEVIKHAFLAQDDKLFRFLEDNREKVLAREKDTLLEMIRLSLAVKKSFIERDPKETLGIRSFLNFGHTFAHALEAIEHFSFSHGAAVAWGCARALEAGVALGVTDEAFAQSGLKLLSDYSFKIDYRIGRGAWFDFLAAIAKDKKKTKGSVKFVLLSGQGKPVLQVLDNRMIGRVVLSSPLKSC